MAATNSLEHLLAPGAAFLWEKTGSRAANTPEDITEDQRALYKSIYNFVDKEILPHAEKLENKEPGLMRNLFKRAADELGLFMLDVAEEHGGLEASKTTSLLVAEALSAYGSWSTTIGAHTTIGMLPIVWFGTDAQKQKYLPKLISGDWMAAYCLTEPGSGSDALAAKAWAEDKGDHYLLNGTKAWITNGGWADVFIVFAKVNREHFTGFIVERGFPGVSTTAEEHKMGLHGSSTVQVVLENARIPKENVLGEIGKGHRIAFNILNVGRMKLGAGALGGSKMAFNGSIQYGKGREQFNTPIIRFGAVAEKIAHMASRIYATEAMSARLGGLLDARIEQIPADVKNKDAAIIAAIEEHNIEASISKVYGSESLAYVVDEAVQILGGNGFSEEYPIARGYRDARITRIYEGTNEINRLLMPGTLLKRMMKGQVDLMTPAQAATAAFADASLLPQKGNGPLGSALQQTEQIRAAYFYSSNMALMRYMAELEQNQEVLLLMAEMMMALYAADSCVLRGQHALDTLPAGDARRDVYVALTELAVRENHRKAIAAARDLVAASASSEDEAATALDNLAKLDTPDTRNAVAMKRTVSNFFIERDGWNL